ncbi:MAG: PD-(D/E)XK nuclease family protein [Candidatus Sungiibacteriota bacterium]
MRTSYSALDAYKQCPQKYKFQEIDRIPSVKGKEAVFGSVFHDALKFMFGRSPLFPTLDEVLAHFRMSFGEKSSGWPNEGERNAYLDEGARLLKNFYAQNAPWNFSVVDLESRFEVLIPDEKNGETHVLAGIIDRIDKLDDGGYEIIDYKTARKLPPQEKVDNDLQLSIYSLGLQKKWPTIRPEKIKLSLYFVKHGEKLSTSRTKEATEATRAGVLATISEIRDKLASGERFEPTPSPLCDWCSYKPICPAWSHLYRNRQQTIGDIQPVVKEYFELAKNKDAAEERMAELKQKIREYMEREGYDRVFGDDGNITRTIQKRFSYDFAKVREILEPLGKWQDVLEADEQKLKVILKELPPETRMKIEAVKMLTKEFTVLTASTKKMKKPEDAPAAV